MPRIIQTPRLILRTWRPEDAQPFAELNADPRVMKYFPAMLSRAQSDAFIERVQAQMNRNVFGFWALEVPSVAPFIGFVGLGVPAFDAHFTPCVEIGWRLASEYWNRGYATEAAQAAVKFAFETVGLDAIVAFTVSANLASRRVMQKLGMTHDPADDFQHPSLPEGHPLRPHVLYRLNRC